VLELMIRNVTPQRMLSSEETRELLSIRKHLGEEQWATWLTHARCAGLRALTHS
jgi:hypothetical protein